MKKKVIPIVACILAVLLLAWLLFGRSKKEKISVEIATVENIDIRNSVTATGTIEPVTTVDVGTQVSGIIDKIYVDFNDVVKKGQVIAEMDRVNLQAELQSANAQLATAKTEFEYRESEYNRYKTLHEKDLVSDSEFDLITYQYKSAQNSYQQAQSSMTKVRRNLSYATITSPIDGVVINRAVEAGQTVAAGFSTPTLFTIANDLTKMRVIANVDEADIGQVKEGLNVDFNVDAYPDDTFHGTVQQVRLEATTTSNVVTYEVVITADNPDLKLKPGLTANVTIYTLEKDNVLSVPTKALRFHPDPEIMSSLGLSVQGQVPQGKHVWVKNGKSISPVEVTAGSVSGDRTEVEGNLAVGQEVIASLTTEAASRDDNVERSPFAPGPRGGNNQRR